MHMATHQHKHMHTHTVWRINSDMYTIQYFARFVPVIARFHVNNI